MSPQAWKYIMGRESYTKIIPEDINSAKEMLNVCFGKDTSLRKESFFWTMEWRERANTTEKKAKKVAKKKVSKKVLLKNQQKIK